MGTTTSWAAKSLLLSTLLGLATYGLFYGFLTIHQETGMRPGASYKPALLVFAVSAMASAIYFRWRSER